MLYPPALLHDEQLFGNARNLRPFRVANLIHPHMHSRLCDFDQDAQHMLSLTCIDHSIRSEDVVNHR